MAGKLIKYDFLAIGRKLGPIYLAVAAMSVLVGLLSRVSSDVPEGISMSAYVILMLIMIIMTLVVIIQRFYQSVYGKDAYMMMTLPATTGEQLWSKVITSLIWGIFTTAVTAASFAVILLLIGALNDVDLIPHLGVQIPWGQLVLTGVLFLLNMVVSIVQFALMIYASISIGAQARNHRGLLSTLVFIGFAIAESIITTMDTSDGNAWIERENQTITGVLGNIDHVLVLALVFAAAVSALYFIITYFLMDRRLNLD